MIKKYAGILLNYIHLKKFEEDEIPQVKELIDVSNWKPHQLEMTLDYCKDNNYLKITKLMGSDEFGIGNLNIDKILPEGIDLVSNEDKFQKNFGFGVNLGLVNFNWGVQER